MAAAEKSSVSNAIAAAAVERNGDETRTSVQYCNTTRATNSVLSALAVAKASISNAPDRVPTDKGAPSTDKTPLLWHRQHIPWNQTIDRNFAIQRIQLEKNDGSSNIPDGTVIAKKIQVLLASKQRCATFMTNRAKEEAVGYAKLLGLTRIDKQPLSSLQSIQDLIKQTPPGSVLAEILQKHFFFDGLIKTLRNPQWARSAESAYLARENISWLAVPEGDKVYDTCVKRLANKKKNEVIDRLRNTTKKYLLFRVVINRPTNELTEAEEARMSTKEQGTKIHRRVGKNLGGMMPEYVRMYHASSTKPTGMQSTVQAAIIAADSGREVASMSSMSANVETDGGFKEQVAALSKELALSKERERRMKMHIQLSDTTRGTAVNGGAPPAPAGPTVESVSDTSLYVLCCTCHLLSKPPRSLFFLVCCFTQNY
jgi:hypothetical protein